MGSIELNVKDAASWQGGRNAKYLTEAQNKLNEKEPKKAPENIETDPKKKQDSWEVLGEEIKKHYLAVNKEGKGIELYEPGGKEPVIVIERDKISTAHDKGAVIEDAVKIAVDRGWDSLKLEGSKEFKDAVWLEAKKYDLKVAHKPSDVVKAEFEKWSQSNELKHGTKAESISEEKSKTDKQNIEIQMNQPPQRDLAEDFLKKSPSERLADPQLRNAELTAEAARKTAIDKFGDGSPKSKIALAEVDKMISDDLKRGHKFSQPKRIQTERQKPVTNQNVQIENKIQSPRI